MLSGGELKVQKTVDINHRPLNDSEGVEVPEDLYCEGESLRHGRVSSTSFGDVEVERVKRRLAELLQRAYPKGNSGFIFSYRSLLFQSVPMRRNEAFIAKIDGNTDSNSNNRIDSKDKNGCIEPEELYEEILSHREKYEEKIGALRASGFEDPFEEIPIFKEYTQGLFAIHKPKTELEKALILFRAVLPPGYEFQLEGKNYEGLRPFEGGLQVYPNGDERHSARKKFGHLLPREIVGVLTERVAFCAEYSNLLVVLLRAFGIDAHTKKTVVFGKGGAEGHVFVIAVLDGERYKLDATKQVFEKTIGYPDTDRESIAVHYINEGAVNEANGRVLDAIRCYLLAIELDPDNPVPRSSLERMLH